MRVSPKKKYPWWIKLFFWKQKKTYGQVLIPGQIWGRSPTLVTTVALLYSAINRKKSPIPGVLRSLITVRVSQINHCAFCVDINSHTFLRREGKEAQIAALKEWRNSELFDEKEKAVLTYADAITFSEQNVTDEMITKLRNYFDDDGIVELTGLIAFQNLSSKFNSALDIPPQGFCTSPKKPR